VDFVSGEGRFWLPRQPARAVHGSVAFGEDGVTLSLADSLRGPDPLPGGGAAGSPSQASEPVIHGQLLDGRQVSLHEARGMSWPVAGIQETWLSNFLFTGGLTDGSRFTHVQVVFDCLMPWLQPAGIASGGFGGADVVIDTRRVTVDEAILDNRTKVRICTGVEGRQNHASVHLGQWAAFEVTGLARKAKTIRGVLDDWVRPLQDLLVVSLGQPVRVDQLSVRLRGRPPRAPLLDVACQLIQSRPGNPPKAVDIVGYTAPTLLTYRDMTARDAPVSFADLMPAWFGLHERHMDVVTDLCGPYYAPFIYSGHRYASTFQSAEALAHGLFPSRQKTRPEHQARVNAVTAALDEAGLDEKTRLGKTGSPEQERQTFAATDRGVGRRGRRDGDAADPCRTPHRRGSCHGPGRSFSPGFRRPGYHQAVLARRGPYLDCPRPSPRATRHPDNRHRGQGYPAGFIQASPSRAQS
jgi:ApeA N-terminal domain 1